MSFRWYPSPCKINLFLHINGRYQNGYHRLQTYFQLLDFGDLLGIEATANSDISLSQSLPGVKDSENLIIRAAELLKKYADVSHGAKFFIKKKLPMGGGLGGGSSNAATTLVALNRLWQTNLATEQLMKLGQKLGADVPVFIKGKSGFASGVGEQIIPVSLPKKWYLIANPNLHISTAEVFSSPDLPRNTPLIDFNDYTFENTANDCQTLVCKRFPEVANLLQWLLNYAPARMTGTGASVFAIFENEKQASKVLNLLPNNYSGFISQGISESTLLKSLDGPDDLI